MPMPLEYARASESFDRLIEDLRKVLDHETRHQSYQTLESVLRIFRRRLTPDQMAIFGNALPGVLRSIFYADLDLSEPRRPFLPLEQMNAEVRAFRQNHDFSPETAIRDVASVTARHVDPIAFQKALSRLPTDAASFWKAHV